MPISKETGPQLVSITKNTCKTRNVILFSSDNPLADHCKKTTAKLHSLSFMSAIPNSLAGHHTLHNVSIPRDPMSFSDPTSLYFMYVT